MRLYVNEDTANNSYVDAYILHSVNPRDIEPNVIEANVIEANIYIMEFGNNFFTNQLFQISQIQLESYECFKEVREVTSLEEAANIARLYLLLE